VWLVHAYWWLENNNLWKAAVAFFVTLFLGIAVGAAMRPWRAFQKHRALQEKIADRLDTGTPGGLSDLVDALHSLLGDLEEGDAPDDNGTDIDGEDRKKRGGHGGHAEAEIRPHGGHSVIPTPGHGGGRGR